MNKTNGLTVFVHVPKTAGSTVNDYLIRSKTPGERHVERWIDNPDAARSRIKGLDWVSGHVAFPAMRSRLAAATSRRLDFHTVIRDPLRQIMSHYNWLIEIYHRGPGFYEDHPEHIKQISQSIRAADNNDPAKVIEQIQLAPGLFLNQQIRTVHGQIPDDLSDATFRDILSVYRDLAWEDTLPRFVETISGLPYDAARRENTSPYHFDRAVFSSPVMQDFLQRHHAADMALYRHVTAQA
jgi:hypothetical protein